MMNGIFSGCSSLYKIPDISKWNTSKVTDMSNMFFECFSLLSINNNIFLIGIQVKSLISVICFINVCL